MPLLNQADDRFAMQLRLELAAQDVEALLQVARIAWLIETTGIPTPRLRTDLYDAVLALPPALRRQVMGDTPPLGGATSMSLEEMHEDEAARKARAEQSRRLFEFLQIGQRSARQPAQAEGAAQEIEQETAAEPKRGGRSRRPRAES